MRKKMHPEALALSRACRERYRKKNWLIRHH